MDEKELKNFLSGSWNGYSIINISDDAVELSPLLLKNKLEQAFREIYEVECECSFYEDLFCIKITLEEKKNTKKKKSKQKLIVRKFKIALNFEEALLFCSNKLAEKYKGHVCTALNCEELEPYELNGSSPNELLQFHRQAAQAQKNFSLEIECLKIFENINEDMMTSSQIGPNNALLPKIKKMSARLRNFEIDTPEENLKDIQMKEILIEMSSDSLLHLYKDFEKNKIVEEFPEWLIACRKSGKTHRVLEFE